MEEEDEEEQVLFLNCVVYSQQAVVNSYILEYLSQHGNTAASNMLYIYLVVVLIVESHQANKAQHCAFNAILSEKSHNYGFFCSFV